MNRRDILKSGLLAAGGVFLSSELVSFKSQSKHTRKEQHITLRLDIGELETYILSDGIVSLNSVQPVFAPDIVSDLVTEELKNLHLQSNKVEAGINVLLIKKEEKLILLDTGSGYHFGANAGKLLGALNELGIEPTDITDIVITHAHIDHIGGILDKEDHFIFPSAKYYIAEQEFQFWMSENPDFSKSKGASSSDFSISFARSVLTKIKNRLNFFQYGDVLFSCLKSELAEGHTLGHTIFKIFSGDKSIKHIVDTFHTQLLVTNPEWGTQWDVDFDKAVKTRERIIKEGVNNKTLFMSCHLPWPGLGYIDKINDSFSWTIYPYFSPERVSL